MSVELGWYVPDGLVPPRWVLAVKDDHLIYANGGIEHRECKVNTFLRWQRETRALRVTRQ